jgi:hypothetical protein
VARRKKEEDLFWRYGLVAHEGRRADAGAVLARHRLKGDKEQMFKEVLRGLDLHQPPLREPDGQRDVLRPGRVGLQPDESGATALPPDAYQNWTVTTLLRQLVRLPSVLVWHAHRLVARVEVAVSWLGWLQAWEARWWTGAGASGGAAASG